MNKAAPIDGHGPGWLVTVLGFLERSINAGTTVPERIRLLRAYTLAALAILVPTLAVGGFVAVKTVEHMSWTMALSALSVATSAGGLAFYGRHRRSAGGRRGDGPTDNGLHETAERGDQRGDEP